jgi:P-type Cu+ transporter
METININVQGMNCTSCALSISKYLEKQGLQQVKVNYITGDVSFVNTANKNIEKLEKGIADLGYTVLKNTNQPTQETTQFKLTHLRRFLFCLLFSAPLFIAHIVHIHWLMNPVLQLALTTPVYIMGMSYFGKSAIKSLLKGFPNMNVLITFGATAAFAYSLYGLLMGKSMEFMFFETTATTLTLVFLGNYLEEKTMAATQKAVNSLIKTQVLKATMIAFDDKYQEQTFEIESKNLKVGDLILIKTGEQVPADCKILFGSGNVNESIITGESTPLNKQPKDILIGGSIVQDGLFKAQVTAAGSDSVLAQIIKLIQQAQTEKPPMQQFADKISAVFVPAVIAISILTLTINYFIFHISFTESLLRSIAVLVISCPCAMGLATPAAIAVGLGRATKNGVLFKDATSLELFKNIKQIVFDKTGTLTTGQFKIVKYEILSTKYDLENKHQETAIEKETENEKRIDEFKKIVYSLEKYSIHPLAQVIAKEWKIKDEIKWATIEEIKGLGIKATDKGGNEFTATSFKAIKHLTTNYLHNIYITKNDELLGWIDVEDEIRPEAKDIIAQLKKQNITTVLLSGDKKENCEKVALQLGIDKVYAEQTPENKIDFIASQNAITPTAMVGDGINDAPALAKASIGISLSEASQLAIQSSQVILMKSGLKKLPFALGIGRHTYTTIQQNLFWALVYNVVAIPVAACGLLGTYGPTYGALLMGVSDVILAINSIRLRWKKVE